MYNDVPTTCFGRFLTGHHQVGIQCQKNYILTISLDISISVSTEKGKGGRSRLQNTGRVISSSNIAFQPDDGQLGNGRYM